MKNCEGREPSLFLCYMAVFFNPLHRRHKMKPYAEYFYKSKAWQDCRNAYMKSVQGLCEDCMKEGKIVPAEEVHHKVFLNMYNINDPNVTLNWDNLVALCREHHRQRHSGRPKPRYAIDEKGRVT